MFIIKLGHHATRKEKVMNMARIVEDTTICPFCDTKGNTDILAITNDRDLVEFWSAEGNVFIHCEACDATGESYDNAKKVLWTPDNQNPPVLVIAKEQD